MRGASYPSQDIFLNAYNQTCGLAKDAAIRVGEVGPHAAVLKRGLALASLFPSVPVLDSAQASCLAMEGDPLPQLRSDLADCHNPWGYYPAGPRSIRWQDSRSLTELAFVKFGGEQWRNGWLPSAYTQRVSAATAARLGTAGCPRPWSERAAVAESKAPVRTRSTLEARGPASSKATDVVAAAAAPTPSTCWACDFLWTTHAASSTQRSLLSPLPLVRTVDVVVSHCDHSLAWLEDYVENVTRLSGGAAVRVAIYSKCSDGSGAPPPVPQKWEGRRVVLPNRGRNDHTYAHHIQSRYDDLADLTLFVKDTLDPSRPQDRAFDTVDGIANVFPTAVSLGFACHYTNLLATVSAFTPWESMRLFEMVDYPLGVVGSGYSQAPRQHRPLERWLSAMVAGTGTPPPSSLWPVCYGGNFAATRASIRAVPRPAWTNMTQSLSRADNLEEGHYAERSWAGLLTRRLPEGDAALLRSLARVRDPADCESEVGPVWAEFWAEETGCTEAAMSRGVVPLVRCRCGAVRTS